MSRLFPTIELSDEAFASRHRALLGLLWLPLPLVVPVSLLTGAGTHDMHAAMLWTVIALMVGCAAVAGMVRTRRARAISVAVGLLLAADALVHGGGGLTDLH